MIIVYIICHCRKVIVINFTEKIILSYFLKSETKWRIFEKVIIIKKNTKAIY